MIYFRQMRLVKLYKLVKVYKKKSQKSSTIYRYIKKAFIYCFSFFQTRISKKKVLRLSKKISMSILKKTIIVQFILCLGAVFLDS